MKKMTVSILIAVLASVASYGDVITLQQGVNGYSGTADTHISTYAEVGWQGYNFGGSPAFNLGGLPGADNNQPGLMRFDNLPSLSAGAIVTGAKLRLYSNGITAGAGEYIVAYPMLTDFVEGDGNWHLTGPGSCGAYRNIRADGAYVANPQDTWGNTGIAQLGPVQNVDYSTANYGVAYITTPGWMEWDITNIVKGWLADSASNKGLYMFTNSSWNMIQFRSSEYTDDASLRPMLEISYAVPEPATMCLLALGSLLVRRAKTTK